MMVSWLIKMPHTIAMTRFTTNPNEILTSTLKRTFNPTLVEAQRAASNYYLGSQAATNSA